MKFKMIFLSVFFIIFIFNSTVAAFEPYSNYTYNKDGALKEPQAYVPKRAVRSQDIKIDNLKNPRDLFVFDNKEIYIADTDNNRVLVLSKEFSLIKTIDSFINNGEVDTFNKPNSMYVNGNGDIYIADTLNKRIVMLNKEGVLLKIYNKPESRLFDTADEFSPLKLVADSYGKLYVITQTSLKGLIQLDKNGEFIGYFGPVKVKGGLSDILKIIYTKEQRARINKFIPTKYSNISIDDRNFIYATISETDETENFISKLNPMGLDILVKSVTGKPKGDGVFFDDNYLKTQHTLFNDIVVCKNNAYSALDTLKKRVFTYDYYGNLLFVFGGESNTLGGMKSPVAIDVINDTTFLVLDSEYAQILVFEPTNYGSYINNAVDSEFKRKFIEASNDWTKVIKNSAGNNIAYIGVGKEKITNENYEEALKMFKIGESKSYYSNAFNEVRINFMRKYFVVFVIVILLIFIIYTAFKFLKIFKLRRSKK